MAKKKKITPASLLVTQSNKLVEARYTLPLGEQRLILSMIAQIQPGDEDFKEYRISINEFAEFMGIDKNHVYAECKKTTKQMLTRVLEIQEPGVLVQTNWVSSAKYVDGEGCVRLCFDPLLKPHLLQLKSNFTSCKLEMLLSFKSQYSMRVYSLLKQYEKLKEREIELNHLRAILGVGKDQYKDFCDFRKRIIQATQKELTEKTDIYFDFEEIKCGRRVGAIRFRIFTKKLPNAQSSSQALLFEEYPTISASLIAINTQNQLLNDELLLLVPESHRVKKTVQSAIAEFKKKHGFDYVKCNILYSNAKAGKSYAGFLVNALKNNWGHDWLLDRQQEIQVIQQAIEQPTVKTRALEVWERQGFNSQKEYDDFMYKKQMAEYKKALDSRKQ
ncbi:Replication initiation protein [Patescibacteria group bacterium]|nr:Replication initiation protein [Patescibacteria group bacterium]